MSDIKYERLNLLVVLYVGGVVIFPDVILFHYRHSQYQLN